MQNMTLKKVKSVTPVGKKRVINLTVSKNHTFITKNGTVTHNCDAAHTNKILVLQSTLEGKGVLIKATGEFVKPAKGFNIFATSNTQGRGSEDGKYIGTNPLNEAFRDRFGAMLHQTYPDFDNEVKLLTNHFINFASASEAWSERFQKQSNTQQMETKKEESEWINKLCKWAVELRKNAENEVGGITDCISTRSLINIVQGYAIFDDKAYAMKIATEKFPLETAHAFIELYGKMTNDFVPEAPPASDKVDDSNGNYHSF